MIRVAKSKRPPGKNVLLSFSIKIYLSMSVFHDKRKMKIDRLQITENVKDCCFIAFPV